MVRSTETARRRTRNASGEISAQPPSALRPRPATAHPATGSPGVRCGDRGGVRLRAPTAGPPRARGRAPVLRRPRRPRHPRPDPRVGCRGWVAAGRERRSSVPRSQSISVSLSHPETPTPPAGQLDAPRRSSQRARRLMAAPPRGRRRRRRLVSTRVKHRTGYSGTPPHSRLVGSGLALVRIASRVVVMDHGLVGSSRRSIGWTTRIYEQTDPGREKRSTR